jgi:hypothetical protein
MPFNLLRLTVQDLSPDQSIHGPRLRVIAAGLPRCATSSLQAALESPSLGFNPCMHMARVAPYASRAQLTLDAMREPDPHRRQKILHVLFDGYLATADFPGFWFVDDLMDMYPDAAIVLNVRSGGGKAWWESLQGALGFFGSWEYRLIGLLWRTDRLHWRIQQEARRLSVEKLGVEFSEGVYEVHNRFVREEARKRGRMVLEWKAEDGWAPLCRFLGKETPKEEFPRLNDRKMMMMVKRVLVVKGLMAWLAVGVLAYVGWTYLPGLVARYLG